MRTADNRDNRESIASLTQAHKGKASICWLRLRPSHGAINPITTRSPCLYRESNVFGQSNIWRTRWSRRSPFFPWRRGRSEIAGYLSGEGSLLGIWVAQELYQERTEPVKVIIDQQKNEIYWFFIKFLFRFFISILSRIPISTPIPRNPIIAPVEK